MTSDLDRVMAAMRAAGWRSSDDRLVATATKRLATARFHDEQAEVRRATAQRFADRYPEESLSFFRDSLRHAVRAAEGCGHMTRVERNVALRLVPSWTGSAKELLLTAQAVAMLPPEAPSARERVLFPADHEPGLSGPRPMSP